MNVGNNGYIANMDTRKAAGFLCDLLLDGEACFREAPVARAPAEPPGINGTDAVRTELSFPRHIALDDVRNLYVTETHRIRKVDRNGVITTVAGTGEAGFSGDGGLATATQLSYPGGIAIDKDRHLYIADAGNNRIRKVDPKGIITTIAGTGLPGPPSSGDGGLARDAELSSPQTLAIDDVGNLYISVIDANQIRRVDPSGIIMTIAGAGTGAISYCLSDENSPAVQSNIGEADGLTIDDAGNLYFADFDANTVRRVDQAGRITTIAGNSYLRDDNSTIGDNGPAFEAELGQPSGLAFDSAGNLYIADA